MTDQNTLPLYDKIWVKHTFSRLMDSLILILLLLLLSYRIFSSNNHTFPSLVAFICESWFTFTWIVIISTKWSPAYTTTYIDRLLLRYLPMPFSIYALIINSHYTSLALLHTTSITDHIVSLLLIC